MKGIRALLLAALGAAGCVTETRDAGTDAYAAAARNDWNARGARMQGGAGNPLAPAAAGGKDFGADEVFDLPARDPSEVVEVPREVYAPIDSFFDNEGYLLGDRIEIDCSFEPFKARLAALAYNDANAKFVARTESRVGDIHEVRLLNLAEGPQTQAVRLPRATFGSLSALRETDPTTGKAGPANLRPFFEIIGTREILIRFHMRTERDLPVFFRARALGTPSALDPSAQRECVYVNANRRRRVRAGEMSLLLEIRRSPDGPWTPVIRDPAEPGGR